jgi:hypothetical protein
MLPAWFAIVAARSTIAITIAAAPTTATAATTITATTAAAVTATATAAAAITATAAAISARARFIHRQISAIEILAVELLDRRRCFFRRGHFDETKAARTTGHAVFDDLSRFHIARLREVIAQIVASRLEREISYVKFCSHFLFCPLMLMEARDSVTEQRQDA